MQNAECRVKIASGKPIAALACALVPLLHSSVASADGGTLRLSQRCDQWQVSVFTSPAMPHIGQIDISTLVQDAATGRVRDDVPVVVRLQSIERHGLTLEQAATVSAATNKLFRAAVINLPEAGKWRVEILVGDEARSTSASDRSFSTLAFDFDVAATSPQWLYLAAWVGWPVAVIAMFLIHQILVARSLRKHSLQRRSSIRQNYVDTI